MAERVRILNRKDARALGVFLGLSTIIALNVAPKLTPIVEEFLITSNTDDYPIVTGINEISCYTKDYPTLSDAAQSTHLRDAYCPPGIDGETKFVELVVPTDTITEFPARK